jgi:C-terminal processing protease CtpA/Prc
LEGRIGFVRLYGFSFREYGVEELSPHVDTIQGTIREIDSPTVCGWIVDLRLNTGGWIMPMLAGVGPIVGEGLVGYFVSPDSVWQEWFYDDGEAGVRPYSGVGASGTPYELIVPDPNVAVLTGPTTNSAGEAVAIAFRGRPKTRSFGQATAGYSTVLRQDILSDDAELWLTYATDADRARQIYGGVVEPDEFVEGEVADDPASGDAVVDAALAWLLSRDDCSMQP